MQKQPKLAVVIPCCNEADVIAETTQRIFAVLQQLIRQKQILPASYLLFVDDGSTDDTWERITQLQRKFKQIRGIKLSKNFGHQHALLAGLLQAKDQADCALSIDADLQQDEAAIPEFVARYREGFDLVYGVRKNRKADSWFKRGTANFFYSLMHWLGVRVIKGHADYRLVSRKVLAVLAEHQEHMLFLRGIFSTLGFKSTIVYHEVKPRYAGKSKYSLHKMISFALTGITSFSFTPIRFVGILGLAVLLGCLLLALVCGILGCWGRSCPPMFWLVLAIYFLGGVQLTCLGVIGEYIGKVYVEVKRRPKFIVEQTL